MSALFVCNVYILQFRRICFGFMLIEELKYFFTIQDTLLLESSEKGNVEGIINALSKGADVNIGNNVCQLVVYNYEANTDTMP